MDQVLAKSIINKHLESLGIKLNQQGDVAASEDNLVTQFNTWTEIKSELESGSGGEIKPDKNGNIGFQAGDSSAALYVNNFAPFKDLKDNISLLHYSGFKEAVFGKKLPTNISVPTADFYLSNDSEVIGIESKFTEILEAKLPNKNLEKYIPQKQKLAYLHPPFFKIIEYYLNKNNKSADKMYLDAAQLIRQSIGLINKSLHTYCFLLNALHVKPVLLYIYWLPVNWYDFEEYRQHEREVDEFKGMISDHLVFIPLSYLEFWKFYENDKLLGDHIGKVKNRYLISFPR